MLRKITIPVCVIFIFVSFSLPAAADEIIIDSNGGSTGCIEGRLTFNNKPLGGHIIHLCDDTGERFINIPNTRASTDTNGYYRFLNVPDGNYAVYASCANNPGFFNRFQRVEIINGGTVEVKEIKLGKALKPIRPSINSVITHPEFEWLGLEGTVEYHFKLWKEGTREILWSSRTVDTFIVPRADELAFEPGKTYRWSVHALNEHGESLGASPCCGAPPWTFTIAQEYAQIKEPEVLYKIGISKIIKLPYKQRVNIGDYDIEYDNIYGIRVWFKQSNNSFVYIWGTRQNQMNRFPGYETRIVNADLKELTIDIKETNDTSYYGYGIYYDFRKGETIYLPNGGILYFHNVSKDNGKLLAEIHASNRDRKETLHLDSSTEYRLDFVDLWISSEINESLAIECQDPRRVIFRCRNRGSTKPIK